MLNECTKRYVKTGYQKPLETDHKVIEQLFADSINIDTSVAGIKMFFEWKQEDVLYVFLESFVGIILNIQLKIPSSSNTP